MFEIFRRCAAKEGIHVPAETWNIWRHMEYYEGWTTFGAEKLGVRAPPDKLANVFRMARASFRALEDRKSEKMKQVEKDKNV